MAWPLEIVPSTSRGMSAVPQAAQATGSTTFVAVGGNIVARLVESERRACSRDHKFVNDHGEACGLVPRECVAQRRGHGSAGPPRSAHNIPDRLRAWAGVACVSCVADVSTLLPYEHRTDE